MIPESFDTTGTPLSKVALQNHLNTAIAQSLYFQLLAPPSELARKLETVSPDEIDWSTQGNPDFLLLNCVVEKNTSSYDLTAKLTSARRDYPFNDLTITATAPTTSNNTNDARNLMENFWRKLDRDTEILQQGPNLSGYWYQTDNRAVIKITHDLVDGTFTAARVQDKETHMPIIHWGGRGRPLENQPNQAQPWNFLHGSFIGEKIEARDQYFNGLDVSGVYSEIRGARQFRLDGDDFSETWMAIDPAIDSTALLVAGSWQLPQPDGRSLRFRKSQSQPSRYTAEPFNGTPSGSPWTHVEVFLHGTTVYLNYYKRTGPNAITIVDRKKGELEWVYPWHHQISEKPVRNVIRIGEEEWNFVVPETA